MTGEMADMDLNSAELFDDISEEQESAKAQAEAEVLCRSGDDAVRIWSFEHDAWWAPDCRGYTQIESKAGLYRRTYAEYIVTQANYGGRKNEEIREVPSTRDSSHKAGGEE